MTSLFLLLSRNSILVYDRNSKIKVRNCVLLNSKDELKSSTVVENKKGRDKPEFRELLTRAKCS